MIKSISHVKIFLYLGISDEFIAGQQRNITQLTHSVELCGEVMSIWQILNGNFRHLCIFHRFISFFWCWHLCCAFWLPLVVRDQGGSALYLPVCFRCLFDQHTSINAWPGPLGDVVHSSYIYNKSILVSLFTKYFASSVVFCLNINSLLYTKNG